jgi:hypothetical protein
VAHEHKTTRGSGWGHARRVFLRPSTTGLSPRQGSGGLRNEEDSDLAGRRRRPGRGDAPRGYDAPRAYDHGYRGDNVTGPVDRLQWRIDNAAREGRISWRQANDLRGDLRQAQSLAWKVQTGRASGWERQRLDRTVQRIEASVSGHDRYDRRDDGRRNWRD